MKEKQASTKSTKRLSQFDNIEIVGLGLSGGILATLLEARGIPFRIYDKPLPGRSSIIAPGIVNPLAGRKFKPPADIHELLSASKSFFQTAEAHFKTQFWYDVPIRRIISSENQLKYLEEAKQNSHAAEFFEKFEPEGSLGKLIFDELGSFSTNHGAWADLAKWISCLRTKLLQTNQLIEEHPPVEIDRTAARVYCEGWQAGKNSLWDFIPWNPAKGEMLIVEFTDSISRKSIYNKGCWLQPLADSNYWRCGATYAWDNLNNEPTLEASKTLHERLADLTPVSFKVIDQVAGVRPIVDDYKPVAGRHPQNENLFILNGLGSKGVLQAPNLGEQFIKTFEDGIDCLPAPLNVNRFT